MPNKNDLGKKLLEARAARARLTAELDQLRVSETALITQGGAALAVGKESGPAQALADLRARREFVQSGINQADENIRIAEQALDNIKRGEAAAAWRSFEESFYKRMSEYQKAIGESGLNGQLEALRVEMHAAMLVYNQAIQGDPESLIRIRGTLNNCAQGLYICWETLESLAAYLQGRSPRVLLDNDYRLPGFGKLR